MRKVIAVVACLWFGSAGVLLACGDKFLIPGRGVRFERTPAERRAAKVLVYAPPASALSATFARLKVEPALRKVGYPITIAETPAALALSASTAWDVVLVDPADGATVRRALPEASLAHLVAVLPRTTGVETARARAEFPIVLRAPGRSQDFLDVLDGASACARTDHDRAGKGR